MAAKTSNTGAQLQCKQRGGGFELVQVDKPTIKPDQILIRQTVIALNDLDRKQRDLGIMVARWPHVLGIEAAGIVEAVGSDVHNVQPGDEVLAVEGGRAHGEDWGGAFQEFVVVPEMVAAKRPKNISMEEAASLAVCYNTAVIGVYQGLNVPLPFLPPPPNGRMPTSVLVLGGSSACGAAAIQLLRLGAPSLPILATSSTKHHAHLTSLGATSLFDYRSSTLLSNITAATPGGRGVDMILDCVAAGFAQKDICQVFDSAGAKIYSSIFTGVDVQTPEGVTKRIISGWTTFEMPGGKDIIPSLTKLVEEGKYKLPLPVRVVGHGLEQIPNVMDRTQSVSGEKLLVTL